MGVKELDASGPNREQIEYWNDKAGAKWVGLQELLDTQLAPLGQVAMDAARVGEGESVVDVGCGCGTTTLEIARRVGSRGQVRGVDISLRMLARARQTAGELGVGNVSFDNADAQTYGFDAGHADLIFSRFGVMFFAEPAAAFANLREALKPNGRMAFVCWRAIGDNPWMQVPTMAAMEHIQIELPTDPHAAGPFAFADEAYLKGVLEAGGFGDITIKACDLGIALGGGAPIEEVASFMIEIGPMGRALAGASDELRVTVVGAVRDSLLPFESSTGIVMPAGTWVVTATPG